MDIDELSGQELDGLAATSVMGWHLDDAGNWAWPNGKVVIYHTCWSPTDDEDRRDMMAVLLRALGDGLMVTMRGSGTKEDPYYAEVHGKGRRTGIVWTRPFLGEALEDTLPVALIRAICKAVKA